MGRATLPNVTIVATTDDIAGLWDIVQQGGVEGIMLKEPRSLYYPGQRSPAWLKVKAKLTFEAVITGGSAERITWGDWGEAVRLASTLSPLPDGRSCRNQAGAAGAARGGVRATGRGPRRGALLGRHAEWNSAASAI
jgi:bifunctional non-homologous end joining protein LigD